MEKHPGTLDVTEEAISNARSFSRALDQAWNVGNNELACLVPNHAQLRPQRSEGIVAHFCRCIADRVEEGRLTGIWKSNEADVREELQSKPNPDLLARLACLVLTRRTAGRGFSAR